MRPFVVSRTTLGPPPFRRPSTRRRVDSGPSILRPSTPTRPFTHVARRSALASDGSVTSTEPFTVSARMPSAARAPTSRRTDPFVVVASTAPERSRPTTVPLSVSALTVPVRAASAIVPLALRSRTFTEAGTLTW